MTTSTSSRSDLSLPPGTFFSPTDYDLTDTYLRCKIAGKELPGATARRFIHVADVYSSDPEKLVEGFDQAPGKEPVWYFFSPVRYVGGRKTNARGGAGRKSRTIDGEGGKRWWHSERGETPVKGGSSEYGGYEQYFSYKVKNASTGKDERAGWIMTEYGISPEHGGGDIVLCKIHRSPRADPSSIMSKKRKAADGDHHSEDSTPSARPRHMDNHDEHQLQAASTVGDADAMTPEDAAERHRRAGNEFIFDEDPIAEFKMKSPLLFPVSDQAAPLSNFLQNVEHDFRSIYHQNSMVMPVGDLAALPWAPAAQPQDDDDAAATGFVQTIVYEVPHQSYNHDGQMEASFCEQQTEPDKTAASDAIYDFPCPTTFSPEMIRRCSKDVTLPWRSSSMTSSGMY